ncbi:hypothetical protein ACO0RG_000112 [Hanseniaspora osmophila]
MTKQTVFVSGATGFIAQHIIKQLLDSNLYKVVGSVRNSVKADKVMRDFGNNTDLTLVIVEDLSNLDAFDSVFEKHGATFDYVLHTACPILSADNDFQKNLITPAINGSKNIFEATVKYAPNVKKFVQTSSYAAMRNPDANHNPNITVNEKSWGSLTLQEGLQNGWSAYFYAKTSAEREVWALHKSLNARFLLTVINPTFVFGPQCFDSSVSKTLNSSCEIINAIVHSKPSDPPQKDIKGNFIDVRDLARAQVQCITDDKLNGQRLLLSAGKYCWQLIANIINTEFPELRGKIAKGEKGGDKQVLNSFAKIDNHVTKELLGFEFTDLETSVTDTVQQILKVEATAK